MKNKELSKLIIQLNELKVKYKFHQNYQENLKYEHNCYDPYDYPDGLDKWGHEMKCQYIMADNKNILNNLQKDIKELRKKIKTLQRLENGKTT